MTIPIQGREDGYLMPGFCLAAGHGLRIQLCPGYVIGHILVDDVENAHERLNPSR